MRPIPIKKCIECLGEFYPRTSFQKFCCYKCNWNNKKGKAIVNGKYIQTNKKCVVCKRDYISIAITQKYCSKDCWNIRSSIKPLLKCSRCGNDFKGKSYKGYTTKYCSKKCYLSDMASNRLGKSNPAYRNGLRVNTVSNYRPGGSKHMRACKNYKNEFIEKNKYQFCEVCGVNSNGTFRFEVHHIYYASLYPKHSELHNFKNLIHVCIKCHNDFHSGKLKEKFIELEKERGLKELFSKRQ